MAHIEAAMQKAQELEAAGNTKKAAAEYLTVVQGSADALTKGLAAVHLGNLAVSKPAAAPKDMEKILLRAFVEAHQLPERSRMLEGRLQMLRSQLILSNLKDGATVDRGIKVREEATQLLLEGNVEDLAWNLKKVEEFLAKAQEEAGDDHLSLPELTAKLRSCGARADQADSIEELFEAWHIHTEKGEVVSYRDFLKNYLELAKRIAPPPCSAPCEGGLPDSSDPLEKALVRLVSQQGAERWEQKAEELKGEFPEVEPQMLEELWQTMKPKLKIAIDGDVSMACGHKCSTCPTRTECQVHDAVKDIEDL